jgi:CRISPR-associated protein Cmr3
MFQYLITVSPLGLLYGSAGAFLSPQNLVGRSGTKFPPEATTIAGLFFSSNNASNGQIADHNDLTQALYVTGPFWATTNQPEVFYVPVPRHRIIAEDSEDEWFLENNQWQRDPNKKDLEAYYTWQSIDAWNRETRKIRTNKEVGKVPWEWISFLHPQMKEEERHVLNQDGLFLENAVQMDEDYCLVYLSTKALPKGWYRFGGEGHMVEVNSQPLPASSTINQLLNQPIGRACALITPGVWGSNNLSYRYPKNPDFPKTGMKMLTDKAVPYRYRLGNRKTGRGQLSRGRYAVPVGTVYVFKQPLNKRWWDFPPEWFPDKGLLKRMGSGLCLPVKVQGIPQPVEGVAV